MTSAFSSSSVVSHPERGNGGKSSYRGNAGANFMQDVILFGIENAKMRPGQFLFCDANEGSGTSRDVAKQIGCQYVGLDLMNGNDFTRDSILTALPRPADMVFTHPPYHCLHPDSLVVKSNGCVSKIANINAGDNVINKHGKVVQVVATASKKNTKKMHRIKVANMKVGALEVTADHKCLVLETKLCKYESQSGKCAASCSHPSNNGNGACANGFAPYHQYVPIWKKAEDISIGDSLLYITPTEEAEDSIMISEYLSGGWFGVSSGMVWYQKNKTGDTKRGNNCKYGVPNVINITEDFSYLLGLYCAEGSSPVKSDGGTVYFTFHQEETKYVESVVRLMGEIFGINRSEIRNAEDDKSVRVAFYSKPIAILFSKVCGKKAPEKIVPNFIVHGSRHVKIAFLKGLFHGDGCEATASLATTSRNMLEQVRMMSASIGYLMPIYFSKKEVGVTSFKGKREYSTRVSYYGQFAKGFFDFIYSDNEHKWSSKMIRFGEYYCLEVKKIETYDYDGDVFDIQVSEGESFLTPSGIVHNCMIEYSGQQWGNKMLENDLSNPKSSVEEFLEKSQVMLMNQREATREGGLYATLIGDMRKKGQFWSFQSDYQMMMPKSELISVAIKMQHNCMSNGKSYGGSFVPIMHEYLLIWRKAQRSLFAIGYEIAKDAQSKVTATWRSVIRIAMMNLGGQATLSRIYDEVAKVAGVLMASNQHWQAKVRQQLQRHFTNVERGVWAIS